MRVLAIFILCTLSGYAKRPTTHEDVWLMKRASPPAISPDGRWVVVPVTEPSYESGKSVTDLWIVPADGSAPARKLTHTASGESGPVFSPDSRQIAFEAKRDGDDEAQIYVLPLEGGEARRVTTLSTGAFSPKWRPDGGALLFQSRVYPGTRNDDDNKRIAKERKDRKYNTRVYESFPIRFWDRWLDDREPHIFVQELKEGAAARDLLAGSKMVEGAGFDGPRGVGDPDLEAIWAPDGQSIVFAATVDKHLGTRQPYTIHLYRVAAKGGEPSAVTSGRNDFSSARFAPGGKSLYAVTSEGGERLYSLSRLAVIPWPPEGSPNILTAKWDRAVAGFDVTPDGKRIYLTAEDDGLNRVFTMPASGGAVEPALDTKDGVYTGLVIAEKAPVAVALWGSMTHPEDAVALDLAKRSHRFLTSFNKDRIAEIDWQPPRHFWIKAKNGKRVHSLMVLPPDFDESRKYPLLLFPHGGPHNMTKDQFFVRWNYHLLTSPGYVLLMTNYTGSTGFGESFAEAIHKDILRGPAAEIEQAADEAIRQFPFIDGSRQAAAGGSYGGYLMAWFEGNTRRFKCLVNHAGLTDNTSFYGATDAAWYWETRNGGPVWEQKNQWRDQSPSAYAANYSTPMLITHGERDYRVPINQALDMYKLLQRQRVPTRLVVFPEENHWILKGENAREHMREVLAWLAKWL